MAKKLSDRRRQALALRSLERAQKFSLDYDDTERINKIRAKAARNNDNNPQPTPVYLLGRRSSLRRKTGVAIGGYFSGYGLGISLCHIQKLAS